MTIDDLLKRLDSFNDELDKRLSIMFKNMTPQAIKNYIENDGFYELMDDMGINEFITDYIDLMDKEAGLYAKLYSDKAVQDLEVLQNLRYTELVGRFKANADTLQAKLYESIINGVTFQQTKDSLKGIGFTDAQTGAIVQTGYYDFSRSATFKAFEDNPDQRFEYAGGIIPTSSDECAWLMMNQKPEGYTFAEIAKGIKTPFVHTGGRLKGQDKIINQFGRVPNWGCIHKFQPVD
jgi:hypothetical protein